jgi:hypothetical protein
MFYLTNATIRSGEYKGQPVASIMDKRFLIQYRSTCPNLKGQELLDINQRIRELHRLTRP